MGVWGYVTPRPGCCIAGGGVSLLASRHKFHAENALICHIEGVEHRLDQESEGDPMGDSIIITIWRRIRRQESRRAELNDSEMARVIEQQVKELLNIDTPTFARRLRNGELDRRDWRVEYLAGLVD